MRSPILLSAAVLLIVTSCKEVEPRSTPLSGNVRAVTPEDVQLAIGAVHRRLAAAGYPDMPIYNVEVISRNEIAVFCGAHFGVAPAHGSLWVRVERIENRWQVTHVDQDHRPDERVIVT